MWSLGNTVGSRSVLFCSSRNIHLHYAPLAPIKEVTAEVVADVLKCSSDKVNPHGLKQLNITIRTLRHKYKVATYGNPINDSITPLIQRSRNELLSEVL